MKKTNWKTELGRFDIHMKTGREKFLCEVAKWYETLYPARADFFKTSLRQLREVAKNPDGSYHDNQGRQYFVTFRVPTELLLFVQRWIPDFGRDSEDIELMCRVWCDLVRPAKDHRVRTRLYVERNYPRVQLARQEKEPRKGEGAAEDSSDRSEHPN